MTALFSNPGLFAPPAPPMWHWQGASGRWYVHSYYDIASAPPFASCNYIFAKWASLLNRWEALYIGQSGEFAVRFDQHEKLPSAIMLGATHVHIHLLAKSKAERLDVETDLRRAWPTPLNEQGDGLGAALDALNALGSGFTPRK